MLDPAVLAILGGGAVLAWTRHIPLLLGEWLRRQFVVSTQSVDWDVTRALGSYAVSHLGCKGRKTLSRSREVDGKEIVVQELGYGVHGARWRGKRILIHREREAADHLGTNPREVIRVSALGRDPRWLRDLLAEALAHHRETFAQRSVIYLSDGGGGWQELPVDLGSKSMSDAVLVHSLARAGLNAAIIFEDMDAALPPVRKSTRDRSGGGLTLSGMLNAFDGALAPEGCVFFITANAPERLDAALRRPGRIDVSVVLGPATHNQARRMFLLWHPGDVFGAEMFARLGTGRSTAELQGLLLEGWTPEAEEAVA